MEWHWRPKINCLQKSLNSFRSSPSDFSLRQRDHLIFAQNMHLGNAKGLPEWFSFGRFGAKLQLELNVPLHDIFHGNEILSLAK